MRALTFSGAVTLSSATFGVSLVSVFVAGFTSDEEVLASFDEAVTTSEAGAGVLATSSALTGPAKAVKRAKLVAIATEPTPFFNRRIA